MINLRREPPKRALLNTSERRVLASEEGVASEEVLASEEGVCKDKFVLTVKIEVAAVEEDDGFDG